MLGRLAQVDPAAMPTGPTEDIITVSADEVAMDIPDHDANGIFSELEVGDAVSVAEAKVSIDITHTYIGDLSVILTGPDGRKHTLHRKEGGPSDDINKTYTISDVGAINGVWTLQVADHYQRDIGVLNGWKIEFLVGESAPEASTETTNNFAGGTGIDIPDNSNDGVSSSLNVSTVGAIKKLVLNLNISHTYIGDLEIRLVKGGISKTVHNREGGSEDDIERSLTIDEFNGQEASGDWALVVRDLANLDKGIVNSWSLDITQ
jgi:subtilisin-like proprotein convertase family protein